MTNDIVVGQYALRTFIPNPQMDRLGALTGNAKKDDWDHGVCIAACGAGHNHAPPDDDCTCGIYGTLTIESLKKQYFPLTTFIVTVIAVEGETIIGETGLRTAAAQVVAYWSPVKEIRRMAEKQFDRAEKFRELNNMLECYSFARDNRRPWWARWIPPFSAYRFWSGWFLSIGVLDTYNATNAFNLTGGTGVWSGWIATFGASIMYLLSAINLRRYLERRRVWKRKR